MISFLVIIVPIRLEIASAVTFITAGVYSIEYDSTIPSTVSQACICSKRCAARFKALCVSTVSTPRSKRPEASLRSPNALEVRRIVGPLKVAASSRTVIV